MHLKWWFTTILNHNLSNGDYYTKNFLWYWSESSCLQTCFKHPNCLNWPLMVSWQALTLFLICFWSRVEANLSGVSHLIPPYPLLHSTLSSDINFVFRKLLNTFKSGHAPQGKGRPLVQQIHPVWIQTPISLWEYQPSQNGDCSIILKSVPLTDNQHMLPFSWWNQFSRHIYIIKSL